MLYELEFLLKTHSDQQALSEQASLRDVVAALRRLANDLGLDFPLALAGAEGEVAPLLTAEGFDPCI